MVMEKRAGSVALQVDLGDSYTPGAWEIVSAPATCSTETVCKIVVRRSLR